MFKEKIAHCLCFALRRESAPFLRHHPCQRITTTPCPIYHSEQQSLLVLETGVGRKRCQTALHWLKEECAQLPKVMIAAGFAGGLSSEHPVGSVIIPNEIKTLAGDCYHITTTWPTTKDCLLSSNHLIATTEEKRLLAQQFNASVVDMESATIAQFCADQDIQFGCVRAISDDVHQSLSPQLLRLLSRERVTISASLGLIFRPRLWKELWRLARNTKKAAKALADSLSSLIEHD